MSEFTMKTPDDGDPVTVYGGTSGNASSDYTTQNCIHYWPDQIWPQPSAPWTQPYDYETGTTTVTNVTPKRKCVACESDEHTDLRSCPEVSAIEYFDSGKIKRIEFAR